MSGRIRGRRWRRTSRWSNPSGPRRRTPTRRCVCDHRSVCPGANGATQALKKREGDLKEGLLRRKVVNSISVKGAAAAKDE